MTINELWHSSDERAWNEALERYMRFVKPADVGLVRNLEPLDRERVRLLDAQGWYDFLYHEYFRWKYTAANRLATTRKSLSKYVELGTLDELLSIKDRLFSLPKQDIGQALRVASSISPRNSSSVFGRRAKPTTVTAGGKSPSAARL